VASKEPTPRIALASRAPTTETGGMTKPNLTPRTAADALRPQIQDLSTDTIAELARLANQLGNVLPLWYDEGDMATPAFIG
jgi:hypothetical protein